MRRAKTAPVVAAFSVSVLLAVLASVVQKEWLYPREFEDGFRVLKGAIDTYGSLQTFLYEGTTVIKSRAEGSDLEIEREFPIRVAFHAPDKLRVEMNGFEMDQPLLIVFNGTTLSKYTPWTHEYSRTDLMTESGPSVGVVEPAQSVDQLSRSFAADVIGLEFREIEKPAKKARLVGQEAIEVNGHNADCDIVEAEYALPGADLGFVPSRKTLWIDKARHVLLRHSFERGLRAEGFGVSVRMITTTTFNRVTLNEPLPNDLFTLPQDATEVSRIPSNSQR